MTTRSQLARTWLLYLIAGTVITLAVMIGALRLLLPMVPRYQSQIREWANTATGIKITFRTLSASWNWTGPTLSFYDVRIADSTSPEPILIARGLSVGVSPWRLLRDREISLARISVQGAQVQAERSADGKLIVQGRPLGQLLRPRRPDAPPVEIDLEDIAVGYVDRHRQDHGKALALTLQQAHLTLTNTHLAAAVELQLPVEYGRRLSGGDIVTPYARADSRHVYHVYAIRVRRRDACREHLRASAIQTGVHYPIPIHLQPAYGDLGYRAGDFPVAETLAQDVLSLPLFPEMTSEQISQVTGALKAGLAAAAAARL